MISTHDEVLKLRVGGSTAMVPTNVGRPEDWSGHHRALSGCHLHLQLVESRDNVAGPERRGVRPRSRPCVAREDEVIVGLDSDGLHPVGDHPRVLLHPRAADLSVSAAHVLPVSNVRVVHPLRLRGIDPDRLDAVLAIAFHKLCTVDVQYKIHHCYHKAHHLQHKIAHLLEDRLACVRIERIIQVLVSTIPAIQRAVEPRDEVTVGLELSPVD